MNNAQIASTVKMLCKSKGVSITKLLEVCNIRKSFIYDLEKRDYTPSIAAVEQIADYFEVSLDYLVGRTANPEVSPETYIAGENSIQTVKSKNVTVNHAAGDMSSEFMAIFEQLDFPDKVKVMNFVLELKNK